MKFLEKELDRTLGESKEGLKDEELWLIKINTIKLFIFYYFHILKILYNSFIIFLIYML